VVEAIDVLSGIIGVVEADVFVFAVDGALKIDLLVQLLESNLVLCSFF